MRSSWNISPGVCKTFRAVRTQLNVEYQKNANILSSPTNRSSISAAGDSKKDAATAERIMLQPIMAKTSGGSGKVKHTDRKYKLNKSLCLYFDCYK